VSRKNGASGVAAREGKVMLQGGTISENARKGVAARERGKVTVAEATEDKLKTVCKDNTESDWCTEVGSEPDHGGAPPATAGGEIIGIPQEKINGL